MNFYNDNDAGAAQWLRELVTDGLIPNGEVDERPIQDLDPYDMRVFDHCHFFAGIGGWPLALRLAGWPESRPVWTASCPCQPFSAAGKRRGQADERHLWPVFFRLVRECRPATIFGEQVASDDGYRWLARVRDDLEEAGYAVGCADLPACSAGAPHIRQRLFWVADATEQHGRAGIEQRTRVQAGDSGGMGNAAAARREGRIQEPQQAGPRPEQRCDSRGLADSAGIVGSGGQHKPQRRPEGRTADRWDSPWAGSVLIPCRDGKWRRIAGRTDQLPRGGGTGDEAGSVRQAVRPEPGLFPLAHGVPGRVGLLRGAGNAINPHTAAKFVKAFLETEAG